MLASSLVSPTQTAGTGNADEWLAGDSNTVAASTAAPSLGVARYRVVYSKGEPARFLGAKEVTTLFSRVCRRAGLPVAYSQGFHPAPRLSFGPALPVGMESEEEFVDIVLTQSLPPGELQQRLNAELALGFHVHAVDHLALDTPSVGSSVRAQVYTLPLASLPPEKRTPSFVAARLTAYREAPTFPMRKRTRHKETLLDAKEFVTRVVVTTRSTLTIETAMTEVGSIRPHEFIAALLGLSAEERKVLRLTKTQTRFHIDPAPYAPPAESGMQAGPN